MKMLLIKYGYLLDLLFSQMDKDVLNVIEVILFAEISIVFHQFLILLRGLDLMCEIS